jgi:hypothetical protein
MRSRLEIPVGTTQSIGSLTTCSLPRSSDSGAQSRHRVVDCLCACGNKTTISAALFLSEKTKSCGHTRNLSAIPLNATDRYGASLYDAQKGICAWPLCHKSLTQPMHVDHDHRCCPGKRSCAYCPRGIVHAYCNLEIGIFERRREQIGLQPEAVEYLDSRRTEPILV